MSMTITVTYHLECDRCHANGGTESAPSDMGVTYVPGLLKPQDGWRKIRELDICSRCIASMTLAEYLAIEDEEKRKGRAEQQAWEERRRAEKAAKVPA